ncbi:C4-dicarboxylate ABC transporter permease [Acuticoccus sediminis]|uniref:TRAP transporter large permease protein n=1 Tax=Acuticoccus sediminis TaxID=2184697 RepID=A0A8B2NMG2_9HYPH|nr:TRAP transporter large permease subunit [Acuticoccus sediminis]RAH97776.1 C4-dicarboxylate ABC transporter permease [Acuticoccus sediminis]
MTAPLALISGLLLLTLGGGVWVGFSLMSVGALSLEVFKNMRVDRFLASDIWTTSTSLELVTLPLFILMGEILFYTRLSENIFAGIAPFVRRLPGRLLHVNVLGCTVFGAVSGSSAATTVTVGRITMKELEARGYDRSIAAGSLAGSGTIGFLIPPSIPLIVYGVLAEVSILDLFIAGVIPGLILAGLFMSWIGVKTIISPEIAPPADPSTTWAEKGRAILSLAPVALLILFVLGSLYAGYASVTEAAAVGVLGGLILAACEGQLTFTMLRKALMGTVRTCSMIGLILAGALFLSKAMARLTIPTDVATAIEALHLSPVMLILLLTLFYLMLGCFLDGLSTIVMTLPVTLPLVMQAGYDPLWFGIFLIVTIEMAQITPPIGFNLFVIRGLTGLPLGRIALASMPFCILMVALVGLLVAFPQLVTFLPEAIR